ncbi:MAG: clostripain-related cysteine peptidase [bacterium]
MEQVGSSDRVNIVAQLDRYSDYSHCKRYFVTKDSNTSTISSTVLQDLGNVDMGSSSSLLSFLNYGISQYPADHYMAILWDHGSGWKRKALSSRAKGLCYDDHGTNLTIHNLRDVFSQVRTTLGKNIDLLGFDACLMQMLEVAYEVRNSTDYIVGSEETMPTTGLVYNQTLQRLVNNPDLTPVQLGNYFVQDYFNYTASTGLTLSNLSMSQLNGVLTALSSFSALLISNMSTYKSTLRTQAVTAQYYSSPYTDYSDLYDFARLVKANISNSSIQTAATSLMSAITTFVAAEVHSYDSSVVNSHGLSIWLPNSSQYSSYATSYAAKLDFPAAYNWDNFLAALWQ